ncbi:2-hydroxyacid dehydrogenase [Mycolicibacterium canariasense]|uniref:2-hydroxyacid dehydrogenase n=1 Tax=Mycolicibacterium canariasense TaxID=228230 RepID=UPI0032D5949B
MTAFRVGITKPIHPAATKLLQDAGLAVLQADEGQPIADLVGHVEALVSHLTDRIDDALLSQGTELRLVANVAAGYDNVDIAAAQRRGITVTNTPGVLTEATADLAIALMLAVARRIPESDAQLRSEKSVNWRLLPDSMGLDVTKQTLGVVGMGQIGLAVAQRAIGGFGMTVLYSGGSGPAAATAREIGCREVSLPTLLAESDFISLHVPLTDGTHHLIDAAALRAMKPEAVLINTARGAVIDEQALVEALREGLIGGAGLDVYEREPAVTTGLLDLRERVVITPHIGSATSATRRQMSMMAVRNVLAVADNREAITPITAARAAGKDVLR